MPLAVEATKPGGSTGTGMGAIALQRSITLAPPHHTGVPGAADSPASSESAVAGAAKAMPSKKIKIRLIRFPHLRSA